MRGKLLDRSEHKAASSTEEVTGIIQTLQVDPRTLSHPEESNRVDATTVLTKTVSRKTLQVLLQGTSNP